MKRLLLGLLVVPALCLAVSEASASWSICGQSSCSYSFHSPRVWFGFDCCGKCCPPGPAPVQGAPAAAGPVAPVTPWFDQFPPPHGHTQAPVAAPAMTQAPAAAPTTLPVSYQTGAGYAPSASGYQVPSYWYGR